MDQFNNIHRYFHTIGYDGFNACLNHLRFIEFYLIGVDLPFASYDLFTDQMTYCEGVSDLYKIRVNNFITDLCDHF